MGVVGAGPVGAVLGQALAAAGHVIIGIAATDPKNIERAEALLPEVEVVTVPEIIEQADLVLLAIPADEISKTVSGIAEAGLFRAGQLLAHTAGEFGFEVLEPAMSKGVIPLAIHPAMTFTGTSIDLSRIRESYFAVAAPNGHRSGRAHHETSAVHGAGVQLPGSLAQLGRGKGLAPVL